jgi:hypothetical protein
MTSHSLAQWVWFLPLVLIAAYVAMTLALHKRLIARLYSKHHVLWLDLGAPTLWDVLLSGGRAPQMSASGKLTYFGWLSTRGYADLDDAVAAQTGSYLAWRGWALLALVAVLILVVIASVGSR